MSDFVPDFNFICLAYRGQERLGKVIGECGSSTRPSLQPTF
jgi:hypothetical protein